MSRWNIFKKNRPPTPTPAEESKVRAAFRRGVLENSVITGYLGSHGPLSSAVKTGWRLDGRTAQLKELELDKKLTGQGRHVVIFVHGLMLSEQVWHKNPFPKGQPWGPALAKQAGTTNLYVRYNTGRSIFEVGRELAACLKELKKKHGRSIDSIDIIAFSLGGLVTQVALHHLDGKAPVRNVFLTGVPHNGAYLARWVYYLENGLSLLPIRKLGSLITIPLALRSASIRQLAEGLGHNQLLLKLPEGINFFIIAGYWPSGKKTAEKLAAGKKVSRFSAVKHVLTDGMVPLSSALSFREQNKVAGVKVVRKDHYRLPYSDEAFQSIVEWREQTRPSRLGGWAGRIGAVISAGVGG